MLELKPIVQSGKKPRRKSLKHPGGATEKRLELLRQGEREFRAECGRVLAEALLWPVPEERVASVERRVQRARKHSVFNWRNFRPDGWKDTSWRDYGMLTGGLIAIWSSLPDPYLHPGVIWAGRGLFTAIAIIVFLEDIPGALKKSYTRPDRQLRWHMVNLNDYVVPLPEDILKKMQTLVHLCEDKGIHTEFSVRHATTKDSFFITRARNELQELEAQWQRWQGEWRLVSVKFSHNEHGQWYTQEHVIASLCGNV